MCGVRGGKVENRGLETHVGLREVIYFCPYFVSLVSLREIFKPKPKMLGLDL